MIFEYLIHFSVPQRFGLVMEVCAGENEVDFAVEGNTGSNISRPVPTEETISVAKREFDHVC